MPLLRAFIGFLAIIAAALLLGWTEHKFKHPAAVAYAWIGIILGLLIIRWCL